MEKKKLPNKRPISFSKANADVNEYLDNKITNEPDFNYSDYICKLVRDDMLNVELVDKIKDVVKGAVLEALTETNLSLTITKQEQELEDEFLQSSLSALDDL
ncbi:MAG: hypothetical protein ACLUPE_14235 [Turicibacter sanguinis]|uniref:hypothetical protein n=1 Tax=Turicibacter sanguinis TaxID=154288 RepID=UPI0039953322